MVKVKKLAGPAFAAIALAGLLTFTGCSGVSEEQLAELDALRSEVKALDKEVGSLRAEKADLEKQIQERNAKLEQIEKDKAETQKNLEKLGK